MKQYVQQFITVAGITAIVVLMIMNMSTYDEILGHNKVQVVTNKITKAKPHPEVSTVELPMDTMSFEAFDNITGADEYIVPNIVHFLRFKAPNFTFVQAVTALAAFKNQRPDKIMFHTDVDKFVGPYWEKVKNTPGLVYEIVNVTLPEKINGQNFNEDWHLWQVGDVIRILMKYGGIFLDNDAYIVQSLDPFRKFEMSIVWDKNDCSDTQVLVANKNARFLNLWLNSYRVYHADKSNYNAECQPTEEILNKKPELVHRVNLLFGVHTLIHNLYKTYWPDWRKQHSIHLLINHRSYLDKEHLDKWNVFDEKNIMYYNYTFGEMAREAYGLS